MNITEKSRIPCFTWTTQEVVRWIDSTGFEEEQKALVKNHVVQFKLTGAFLFTITKDYLIDWKIATSLHQGTFLHLLECLTSPPHIDLAPVVGCISKKNVHHTTVSAHADAPRKRKAASKPRTPRLPPVAHDRIVNNIDDDESSSCSSEEEEKSDHIDDELVVPADGDPLSRIGTASQKRKQISEMNLVDDTREVKLLATMKNLIKHCNLYKVKASIKSGYEWYYVFARNEDGTKYTAKDIQTSTTLRKGSREGLAMGHKFDYFIDEEQLAADYAIKHMNTHPDFCLISIRNKSTNKSITDAAFRSTKNSWKGKLEVTASGSDSTLVEEEEEDTSVDENTATPPQQVEETSVPTYSEPLLIANATEPTSSAVTSVPAVVLLSLSSDVREQLRRSLLAAFRNN